MGSLEFAIGAVNTQLILVLGHTSCSAILGATKARALVVRGFKGVGV